MKFFNNLKIRAKMFVGFGAVIAVLIAVSVYSLVQVRNIEESFTYAINHPIHGEIRVLEFRGALREFRRIAATIPTFAHQGDLAEIESHHLIAVESHEAGILALDLFDAGMRIDPRVPQEIIDAVLADTAEFRRLFNEYLTAVYNPLIAAAREFDGDAADLYLTLGAAIAEPLATGIDELLALANFVAEDEIAGAIQDADNTFMWLIILTVAGILVSVLLSLFVSSVTTKELCKNKLNYFSGINL